MQPLPDEKVPAMQRSARFGATMLALAATAALALTPLARCPRPAADTAAFALLLLAAALLGTQMLRRAARSRAVLFAA